MGTVNNELDAIRASINSIKSDLKLLTMKLNDLEPKIRETHGYLKALERNNFRKEKEAMIKENERAIKKLQEENDCHKSDIQAFERKYWEND